MALCTTNQTQTSPLWLPGPGPGCLAGRTDRRAREEVAEVGGPERQENSGVFRASGHEPDWGGRNALENMDVALESIENVTYFINYLY